MAPKIVLEHIDNKNARVTIEIDCGFILNQKKPYIGKIIVFSGHPDDAKKVADDLRAYWGGENKTEKDAVRRVNDARFGSLVSCTREYQFALQKALQEWADDLKTALGK